MPKLLIASRNTGKFKEIRAILKNIPYEIISLDDLGITSEIPENGKSFRENAEIKAKFAGQKSGLLTLAEDSGLEIDVLNGRPGIYSARYIPGSDTDRLNKVLEDLKGVAKNKRTARFVCAAALFDPLSGKTIFFEGESKGLITEKPQGAGGFGYDPIFYNFDLKKTNATATPAEKNRVSHRARALCKLRDYIISSIQ